ncbi:MAG: hypothetical protein GY851_30395 [bacterium]|nr:hypothetical protein [bacterium]
MENCEYCGSSNNVTNGACEECNDHFDADPTGPTILRADGSEIKKDSNEYNATLAEVCRQAR